MRHTRTTVPMEVRGDFATNFWPLTEIVESADRIHQAFGSTDPIDVAIRRDAYKLYDISFGVTPGTTQRIYGLRQASEMGADT